ncbi:hypothetical protein [Prevotella sp. P6B4]|uniref:hypothetical protein n=1 Tax=Prevotella sp. P6B4 TaxID=1410614 RepID=UPI00048D7531|nr:hypothetical protein [Prevotella sp. P6B4]
MKKKIINGIMMVALLFATVTSFVSCKDNDEDLKIDVTATLLPDIQKAQQDITNLQTSKADASTVTTLSGQLTTLQNTVNNLKYATPEQFQSLKDELAAIQAHIKDLVYALENMVTSVTVNATATSIIPNSKIFPGINMQLIGAAYGDPVKPAGEFPSTDASLYVDGNALPAALIAGDTYSWDENTKYIGAENGNEAGKVYFTLNPSNVDPANLKSLKLVNSKQEDIATLGEAKVCEDELTWGQTRGIGYDQTHAAKLWVADATMDVNNVKQAIDLKKIIDFKSIKNSVETMINTAKTSGVKTAGKTVLQESAKIATTLITAPSNIEPMTAVALKAEWNDTIGTRSVLSDYSIAATAYKPLSFAEFKDVQFTANVDLSKIDNAVYKFANKFHKTIDNIIAKVKKTNVDFSIDLSKLDPNKFNVKKTIYVFVRTGEETAKDAENKDVKVVTIKKIYFSTEEQDPEEKGYIDIHKVDNFAANEVYYTTVSVGENLTDEIKDLKKAVENGFDTSSIQDLLKQAITSLRDVEDGVDDIVSLADRVTNYLSTIINKSINFIGTGRVLEPILLVNTDNGIQRATGNYTAGTYTFIPTTLNYEVLAPAYKKYIAVVDANGDVRYKTLKTKGEEGFKNLEVELKANDTKIVYAAMDFRGYQIAKVYDITVK